MKIGILKETKTPVDNRVALTPTQVHDLMIRFPNVKFKVQKSDVRAFNDDEYRNLGIDVVDDIDDCDLIFGIKEANLDVLKPNRHYIFFGHIAKRQRYNIPLFKTLLKNNDTFSDYEYLVNDSGERLVAFGWFAGVVGVYYTLIGWGRRTGAFTLPWPHHHMTVDEIISNIREYFKGNIRIVITGTGRVSQGAQHVLNNAGARELSVDEFTNGINGNQITSGIEYCVAPLESLVARKDDKEFSHADFFRHPENYKSTFSGFAQSADMLISAHYWGDHDPVYLSKEDYLEPGFRIKMIGDITCDIQGSIKSTLRSSTHADPYYDYNPVTGMEEPAFSSDSNISVMAVDTCPNALPRITSEYFGERLIKQVLNDLLSRDSLHSEVLDRATIVDKGELGANFRYLDDYVAEF